MALAALAALERRLVDERFDADETAEWASTRAWELADAAAREVSPERADGNKAKRP